MRQRKLRETLHRLSDGRLARRGGLLAAAALLATLPARAGISAVQFKDGGNGQAASSATVNISPTAGNDLVLAAWVQGTTVSISSVKDSKSDAFTKCGSIVNGFDVELWYFHSVPSGVTSVTVTLTGTGAYGDYAVEEYSGVSSEGGCASNTATGGSSSTGGTISGTISSTNDFFVAALGNGDSSVTISATTGTLRGWCGCDSGGAGDIALMDNTGATSLTVADSFGGKQRAYGAVSIDLKSGGGGPPCPRTLLLLHVGC